MRIARSTILLLLSFVILVTLAVLRGPSLAPAAFAQRGQNSGFLGEWCAQGDRSKRASITSNGPGFLTLTNEQGSSSPGSYQGMNQNVITAIGWMGVTGTLTSDGQRIDWSNGTFWARCYRGGDSGGGRLPNLQGTWYQSGDHSKPCSISQSRDSLTFTNEQGKRAQGSFTDSRHITSSWSGRTINGTLVNNAGQINWDNGTMWSR